MDTTMVLSMRSLTTLPTRTLRRARSFSVVSVVIMRLPANGGPGSCLRGDRAFLFAQHGQQPRHLAPPAANLERVVELLHGIAKAQIEQLFPQFGDPGADFLRAHVTHAGRRGHGHDMLPPSSWRSTKRVRIGSLDAPSFIACCARTLEMPSSSNITRPGLTTATQNSGAPLPLPMRVSAGFFVTGLSGKIRIHILPPRLMLRVMATRAASIWRFVSHAGSSAWSPYSPNVTEPPRYAFPHMRPRCCLRYLTRFGISMGRRSYLVLAVSTAAGLSSTSPWNIQTFTPHVPYAVFAVARAKSMSARSVWSGTRPSR